MAYEWAFGDGATAQGQTATHEYATPGTYTATLTVTDDGGRTGVAVATVVVREPSPDQPPVAVADQLTTRQDTARTIDVLANDSDPEGGALTIVDTGRAGARDGLLRRAQLHLHARRGLLGPRRVHVCRGGSRRRPRDRSGDRDRQRRQRSADRGRRRGPGRPRGRRRLPRRSGLGRPGRIDRHLHVGLRRRQRPADEREPRHGPRVRDARQLHGAARRDRRRRRDRGGHRDRARRQPPRRRVPSAATRAPPSARTRPY